MTTLTQSGLDGDRHLSPPAYCALAVLAALMGLSASYVTIKMFALAIQATEPEGSARELLTLAATLFVVAELAACFLAGLLPVRRLRALRWQLTACAVALVAFEAVSLYGARVVLVQAADARADAGAGRIEQLRASIAASRRSAEALLAVGRHSSQSAIASSRADGAQSIRDAAALEADTQRLATELAQLQAARAPTTTAVFGEAGVIALAVAQSLLMSCIGLLFLGAAGALARAARDAASTDAPLRPGADAATTEAAAGAAPLHPAVPTDAAPALDASPATWRPSPAAGHQSQSLPRGAIAAVLPSWGRYALPASALAAGAGLLVPYVAQAGTVQAQSEARASATDTPAEPATAAPRTASVLDTSSRDDDARFLRVKEGIEAGHIKPSIRAIYAVEGASQQVARRYLVELERLGIIEPAGPGRGYRLRVA